MNKLIKCSKGEQSKSVAKQSSTEVENANTILRQSGKLVKADKVFIRGEWWTCIDKANKSPSVHQYRSDSGKVRAWRTIERWHNTDINATPFTSLSGGKTVGNGTTDQGDDSRKYCIPKISGLKDPQIIIPTNRLILEMLSEKVEGGKKEILIQLLSYFHNAKRIIINETNLPINFNQLSIGKARLRAFYDRYSRYLKYMKDCSLITVVRPGLQYYRNTLFSLNENAVEVTDSFNHLLNPFMKRFNRSLDITIKPPEFKDYIEDSRLTKDIHDLLEVNGYRTDYVDYVKPVLVALNDIILNAKSETYRSYGRILKDRVEEYQDYKIHIESQIEQRLYRDYGMSKEEYQNHWIEREKLHWESFQNNESRWSYMLNRTQQENQVDYELNVKISEEEVACEILECEGQPEQSYVDHDPYYDTRTEDEYWEDRQIMHNE